MRLDGKQVRKVTLLKKSTTYDKYNQPVESWAADTANYDNGNLFVEWWDQGGKEALQTGQVIAVKDVRCKCYYIPGLNERDYRIQKDGVEYDIQSIKEIGRKEGQMLILDSRDNQ